jgi:integrase
VASFRKKTTRRDGTSIWQAVWSVVVDGDRRQQTKNFAKAADAKRYAAEMAETVERRGIADPDRQTVRIYLKRWIDHLEKRGQHSITTLPGYRLNIERACRHIGDIPLHRLTPRDLDACYVDLLDHGGRTQNRDANGQRMARPLSARTVHHVHRALSTAFKQAVKWRLIAENPCNNASPPTPAKAVTRAMTETEVSRVMDTAESATFYPGLDVLARVLLIGGVRRSEALALAWDCVDIADRTITIRRTLVAGADRQPVLREHVTKTETSRRVIPIDADLAAMLAKHKLFILEQAVAFGGDYQRSPLLCFPEPSGLPMKPDTASSRMRLLLRKAGIEGVRQGTHVFRHTMGSHLIRRTDIVTVSRRMGHSRVSTTADIYLHGDEQRDVEAGNLLGDIFAKRNDSGT